MAKLGWESLLERQDHKRGRRNETESTRFCRAPVKERVGVNGGSCSKGHRGAVGANTLCPGSGRESRDDVQGVGWALLACWLQPHLW